MEEILTTILLEALEKLLRELAEKGVDYIVRKIVDSTGKTVSQIVVMNDEDGDGEPETETVLYTLDVVLPDLESDTIICEDPDDGTIGIGRPQLLPVDGQEVLPYFEESETVSGKGNAYLFDFDGDGTKEAFYSTQFDFTGDGVNDWITLKDENYNGIPDASPDFAFYPIGSDGYNALIEKTSDEFMTKPLDDYTVTEGLLFLAVMMLGINFLRSIFVRKDVFR